MKLSPLPSKRARLVPVGILDSEGIFSGDDDAEIFYFTSINSVLRTIRRVGGIGTAISNPDRYRWLSFRIGDHVFYPLGEEVDFSELSGFRDYCYSEGISARSIQGMGFYLLRQSLAGTVELDEGKAIPLSKFPAGAFVYAREGEWENLYQSDIIAAYLSALGNYHSPTTYHHIRRISVKDICTMEYGFALVEIRGDVRFTPRLANKGQTAYGEFKGWSESLLTFGDIRIAVMMGCKIRVKSAWIAKETHLPFLPFLRQMTNLRSTDCPFYRVAKLATNSVWGSFTAGSEVKEIHFRPGFPTKTVTLPPRRKICQPLAFAVIGSLRERIILEGMHEGVVHAHTDGILSPKPLHTGDNPGDWRVSGFADIASVVRPSCYSMTVNGVTTYKVSGHSGSSERLRDMFRGRIENAGR